MRPDIDELLRADSKQLAARLGSGHAIDPRSLDDSCYRGISLGLPGWVEALSWKTFMKCFHRDPATGSLRGWNVRLEQDGLEATCRPKTRRGGQVHSFGHFEVVSPEEGASATALCEGLLIHYGLGRNAVLDPIRRLRDPIVAVRPDDPSLLLGRSFLDLGFSCPTPSYFTLERVSDLAAEDVPPS